MKIIPAPFTPVPTPPPPSDGHAPVEPQPPSVPLIDEALLDKALAEFKAQTLAEVRQNSKSLSQLADSVASLRQAIDQKPAPKAPEPTPPNDLQLQQSRDIAKLTDEIGGLRRTLVEFQMPKIAEPRSPSVPPGDPALFDKALAEFKTQTLAEVRQNSKSLSQLTDSVASLRQAIDQKPAPKAPEPTPPNDLQLQQSRDIAKLTDEIAALRRTLVEFQMPKNTEARPAASPPPIQRDPPPPQSGEPRLPAGGLPAPRVQEPEAVPAPPKRTTDFLDALAVSLPKATEEKKVAFLTKVWDYLNQTAFEIPLRRSDRPN